MQHQLLSASASQRQQAGLLAPSPFRICCSLAQTLRRAQKKRRRRQEEGEKKLFRNQNTKMRSFLWFMLGHYRISIMAEGFYRDVRRKGKDGGRDKHCLEWWPLSSLTFVVVMHRKDDYLLFIGTN
jgi:hypothetical protein